MLLRRLRIYYPSTSCFCPQTLASSLASCFSSTVAYHTRLPPVITCDFSSCALSLAIKPLYILPTTDIHTHINRAFRHHTLYNTAFLPLFQEQYPKKLHQTNRTERKKSQQLTCAFCAFRKAVICFGPMGVFGQMGFGPAHIVSHSIVSKLYSSCEALCTFRLFWSLQTFYYLYNVLIDVWHEMLAQEQSHTHFVHK